VNNQSKPNIPFATHIESVQIHVAPPPTKHVSSLPPEFEAQLRRDFLDAVSVIDRAGASETLDEVLLNRDPQTGKIVGRPRTLTPRAVLVSGVVNFLQGGPAAVEAIAAAMNLFPEDLLRSLQVPDSIPAGKVPLHKVAHVWNRISEACNPSNVHAGKRLRIVNGETVNEFHAKQVDAKCMQPDLAEDELWTTSSRAVSTRGVTRAEQLTPEQQLDRRRRLNVVCDSLLQATIPAELVVGGWAADWTDFETWALSYKNDARTSADPDARWGHRRVRGNRSAGGRRSSSTPEACAGDNAAGNRAFESDKEERYFGYNAHISATTSILGGPKVPELAASVRLTAANDMAAVAPLLVEMTDSIMAGGFTVSNLYIDRGYSMRTSDTWLVPLSDRGVFVSFDLEKIKLGRHGSHHGAVLIGGEPYCVMTPDELSNERIPPPQTTREEWKEFWERREQLDQFAFRRLGKPTADLHQRFQCPAAAGKVRCPLQQASMSIPADKDIPEIYNPPTDPPRCCTNPNMTMKRSDGLGYRQQFPHGSMNWVKDYEQRSAVERYNSSIKLEQEIDRPNMRVLGLARVTLMLSMACVATNIRHLRNWERQHPDAPISTLASSHTDDIAEAA